MALLSRFFPTRRRESTGSDDPSAQKSAISHGEKDSQDNKSLSSLEGKNAAKTEVEEADLVSPGSLTLDEGEL